MKKPLFIALLLGIFLLFVGCATMPSLYVPQTPPPAPKLPSNPEVALVLGGGGARGYAHIGVLKVLKKAGVPINLIVGTSAGSIIGALYADSGNPAKVQRIMAKANLASFVDISRPDLQGLISGSHLQAFLIKNMHARTFKQLKIKFVAVATNLKDGKPYVIQSGPIAMAVRGSTAIPGLVEPVHLYGKVLVDGSTTDPVPVDVAKRFHPKVIIAVNISKVLTKNIPKTSLGIYDRAYAIVWQKLNVLSEKGANIIIHPAVGDVNMFNLWDKKALEKAGENAAKKALPQILALLKENHIPTVRSLPKKNKNL